MSVYVNKNTGVVQTFPQPSGDDWVVFDAEQPSPYHVVAIEEGVPVWVLPEVKNTQCTPAQGLVALFALKQISEEDILQLIGDIEDPVQQYTARVRFQRATYWERTDDTTKMLSLLLNLSDQDLDDLFEYAATV